jgi:hypothetical protein
MVFRLDLCQRFNRHVVRGISGVDFDQFAIISRG